MLTAVRHIAGPLRFWYTVPMHRDIVLSGIQPTGTLHLGNYLGMLKQSVALQADHDCWYFLADLHALTVVQDPKKFAATTLEVATDLLALGIDPKRSTLFVQSQVPEHTELMWLLATLTPLGELERMTQYKDKAKENTDNINAGLLTYPILMAADILLYRGAVIPVGEDQQQHVEFARILVRKFNNRYGQTFAEPKAQLVKGARIMSLMDPKKKMSKSHGEKSYIALADSPATIKDKVMKAVTATTGGGENPGAKNLLAIMREVSDAKVVADFENAEKDGSIRYADLKAQLAADLADHLAPFRKKRAELLKKPKYVLDVLEDGRKKASKAASATMAEVRKKVGLLTW